MMDERYKEARSAVIGLEAPLNEIRDGVSALHLIVDGGSTDETAAAVGYVAFKLRGDVREAQRRLDALRRLFALPPADQTEGEAA